METLPYDGQSAQDRLAFTQYKQDLSRGKSHIQLQSVQSQITDDIRRSWSPRSFTDVQTPIGVFDAIVCNISYHTMKHGEAFANIADMTRQGRAYFHANRAQAKPVPGGLLKFPNGSVFEPDGRIVTFFV
jgi:hypothetical protein